MNTLTIETDEYTVTITEKHNDPHYSALVNMFRGASVALGYQPGTVDEYTVCDDGGYSCRRSKEYDLMKLRTSTLSQCQRDYDNMLPEFIEEQEEDYDEED